MMKLTNVVAAMMLGAACAPSARVLAPAQSALMKTVVGSWSLMQGCGGIAYHCTGAGSLTVPNVIVFYSDGTMDQFRAGVKVAGGTFSLTPSATDSLRSGTAMLNPGLEGPSETLALSFSIEGQLMLAEPCCDRLTYSFTKNNGPD
jgi:hypothetical protein